MYLADTSNNTVRKITPTGVVSTLEGMAGTMGSAATTSSAAQFNNPSGIATDSMGNVYVADVGNHTIRKITPAGVVSTLAGMVRRAGFVDGTGSAAQFNNPSGIATDSMGSVYVADTYNHTIRKITLAGVVTTLAGMPGTSGSLDGLGSAARFHFPFSVATDVANNVYVADTINQTIRKITPTGGVSTLAGVAGQAGSADGPGNTRGTRGTARFYFPTGVATDGAANVYVADTNNNTIRKITPAGMVSTLAGVAGQLGSADSSRGRSARFNNPNSIVTDATGNVYVADTDNQTIRKITPAGAVSTLAGVAGQPGFADGVGNFDGMLGTARFSEPTGIATDATGNVYVADTNNQTIRKVTPAGVVSTVAGTAGQFGSADGRGRSRAARFSVLCLPASSDV